jgi:hypothetical protein
MCATKLNDGMGGNPLGLYQGAHEPLGLSRVGRSAAVSSMPLKGTREARGKPPRREAWLMDRMVRSHEVGFNLRGMLPLSQDLARWDSQWREMSYKFVFRAMAANHQWLPKGRHG